jgi:hypothetical protein
MRLAVTRTALASALALAAGATAVLALPSLSRAADETPHEVVERLLPQLMSQDQAVRADAEKQLFGLGAAGRAEMQRLLRDSDPGRVALAQRLVDDKSWDKVELKRGELRAERDGQEAPAGQPSQRGRTRFRGFRDFGATMDQQLADIQKQLDEMQQSFSFEMPDMDAMQQGVTGESNGSIVENDKTTTWSIAADGHVKVTVKDGKDAPEQKFEAADMDTLKKEHPEVAARLEKVMPQTGRRGFVFRFDPQHLGEHRMQRLDSRELFGNGRAGTDRDDLPQLENAVPPVLGIGWSPVPEVLRDQLDVTDGVVVENVVAGSLAEKLGLARHDVLTEIAGKPVNGASDVHAVLDPMKAGETVKAVVIRKGQRKTLEAVK